MKAVRQGSYTVKQAAERLGVSEKSVRRMKDRGILKPIPLGLRSVRFPRVVIDAMVQERNG